jgi:hypothetical protein
VEEVRAWQARPLEPLYPIVYLDALYVRMRDNGQTGTDAFSWAVALWSDSRSKMYVYFHHEWGQPEQPRENWDGLECPR